MIFLDWTFSIHSCRNRIESVETFRTILNEHSLITWVVEKTENNNFSGKRYLGLAFRYHFFERNVEKSGFVQKFCIFYSCTINSTGTQRCFNVHPKSITFIYCNVRWTLNSAVCQLRRYQISKKSYQRFWFSKVYKVLPITNIKHVVWMTMQMDWMVLIGSAAVSVIGPYHLKSWDFWFYFFLRINIFSRVD